MNIGNYLNPGAYRAIKNCSTKMGEKIETDPKEKRTYEEFLRERRKARCGGESERNHNR